MFVSALKFLNKIPPAILFAILAGLTLLIGYFDYRSGTDTTFSAIYLFPICAAAWFLSRSAAWALATLSSMLWVSGDVGAGAHYANLWIPLWNLAARFAIFLFATQLIFVFRQMHVDLERRAMERAAKLIEEIAMRERLQCELLQISEREQERVGHDIHDSLCQHLTGTALAAEDLAESLQSQNSSEQDNAARVVDLVEEGITLARNLARGLNGVEVANNGLTAALDAFASSTSDLFNVSCRFECPEPFLVDDLSTAIHLYRIAQEAVGNAIKHGEAKDVVIQLENSGAERMLRVIDNGKGLAPSYREGKGMGLRIMSYRSQLIGAHLDIHKHNPKGTELTCSLPMEEAAQ